MQPATLSKATRLLGKIRLESVENFFMVFLTLLTEIADGYNEQ